MAEPSAPPSARSDTSPRPLPRAALLISGLSVGVVGDLLLRAADGLGLNVLLFFAGLALAVGAVSRAADLRPSTESWAWFATGLLLAAGLVLRASPPLQLLAVLGAAALFALPALRAGAPWARGSGVSEQAEAIVGAMAHAAFGTLRFVAGADVAERTPGPGATGRTAFRVAPTGLGRRGGAPLVRQWRSLPLQSILLGLLLATPFVVVFGAIFMSADRVFAGIVRDLADLVHLDEVGSHLVLIGVLGWLACGYLSGYVTGTALRRWLPLEPPRPRLGIVELGTALAAIDLLFSAFVLVQFRYLFGGSGLVEVTPGLTHAEYAREGFAQLVLATALVLPCLLASDWVLRKDTPRDVTVFRLLGGLQLLLLLVVIASAVQRLRAYLDTYGLTESRFYAAVFLGWLTLLLVWFAASVLRGHRERFAFPALVSGVAVIVALFVANPDARIASANLERARSPGYASSVDAAYLSSLSADAVPTLIDGLPALRSAERCTIARSLLRTWNDQPTRDWRAWNASAARARRLVGRERTALETAADERGCPPAA